jgi:hypothetical protein
MSKQEDYQKLFIEFESNLELLRKRTIQHQMDFIENPNTIYIRDIEYLNRQIELIIEYL